MDLVERWREWFRSGGHMVWLTCGMTDLLAYGMAYGMIPDVRLEFGMVYESRILEHLALLISRYANKRVNASSFYALLRSNDKRRIA